MGLIDADKIPYREYLGDDEPRVYKSEIDAMPTVDAVPVRCGECKFLRTTALTAYCPIMNNYPAKDFYCGAGERKDGEK